jgi:hypothetical protein
LVELHFAPDDDKVREAERVELVEGAEELEDVLAEIVIEVFFWLVHFVDFTADSELLSRRIFAQLY